MNEETKSYIRQWGKKIVLKAIRMIFLLVFVGCAIGKQGVYFDEMGTPPILKINKNILTVKTSNSNKNSALLIYKVQILGDQKNNEVLLSAQQAANQEYKEIFTFNLADYEISKAATYSFIGLTLIKGELN